MNNQSTPHTVELSLHQMLEHTEDFVRREPAKAVAAAFGAGLMLKLLPSHAVARAAGVVVSRILPPTLLALGVLKVFELCCERAGPSEP